MSEADKDLLELEDKVEDKVEDKQTEPELSDDEKLAVEKGWKPKKDWIAEGGKEEDWKPAKVFNEIGELKERLNSSESEKKKLNKVVQLMKEHHLKVRDTAYQQAYDQLKRERLAALEGEEFAKAEKIRDQMDELRTKFKEDDKLPAAVEKKIEEEIRQPDPEFFKFMDRNPWYKPGGVNEMSKKADALGWAYAQENPDWTFTEVIKHVETDIRKLYPDKFATPRSPVNDSGTRDKGSGGGGSKPNLSEEELAIAKGFGMTPEEYAKEQKSYRGR